MAKNSKQFSNKLKQVAVITFLLPGLSWAECYQESVTVNKANFEIKEITDLQKFVKTEKDKQSCLILFRAKIDNKWYDARGESQGRAIDSTDQICSQALHLGRTTVLERITGSAIQSSQTLYCNDFETPNLKKGLKKYDTFKISELKPMPNSQPFEHKGTICRNFLESDLEPKTNNLMQWQIVGCIIRDEWTVVDKY